MRRFLTAASLPVFLATAALAQEAVPLTDELFELAWVITEFEGQRDLPIEGPATFFVSDRVGGNLGGMTQCGTDWLARIEIDLPAVTIHDVEGFYTDECPAYLNTIALFKALEQVTTAQTGPEGLELLAEDGRRLMLLNAGG